MTTLLVDRFGKLKRIPSLFAGKLCDKTLVEINCVLNEKKCKCGNN